MLFPSRPTVSLTLIVSVLLTLAVTSVEANHPNHANLRRLIKKRSPLPALGDAAEAIINVVGNPNDPNDPNPESLSNSGSSTSTSASASTSASLSVNSLSNSKSDSSASATSTPAKSSTTSASEAAQTSPPPTQQSDPNAGAAQEQENSTVFKTSVVQGSAAGPTGPSTPKGGATKDSKAKSTVITVLIAVAASVGGLAIIWTIFRKWKLGHSSKFDDRLAPIDWQPTTGDDGIIPANRRHSGSSSMYSSSTHGNGAGRGAGGYQDRLDHDFTAGPTHLAPVGGYADLARGSSPQPQMQESLNRGPSMNRPAYDTGVPLHHQTGYGRNADAYDYNGDAVRF